MDQKTRSRPTLWAYLVGVYLFSVPAFSYSESPGLLIIPQITGALLVALAILDILGNQHINIPREIQLYGLLGLWAFITFSFGINTGERESLKTLIKVVIATLSCAQLIKDENDFFAALKIFVLSILFVYYQNRYDLQYLRLAGQITEADRFAGTLASANTAAIYSLTVTWASLLLLLRSQKALLNRVLYFIPIAISLLIIYYSGSKKGMIGTGLFALFLARLLYIRQQSSPSYRKSLVVLVSAFIIIFAGYFVYTSPFFYRVEQMIYGRSASDMNRSILAREAIQVWLMNWKTIIMGVGHGNFKILSSLQTYSHSTPLEILASNGIIGLSLFMGFLLLLFRKFILLYRYTPSREAKSIFFSILLYLSIFSFFMLAAVMHDSRELLPMLASLAAFGQYRLRRLGQSQANELHGL